MKNKDYNKDNQEIKTGLIWAWDLQTEEIQLKTFLTPSVNNKRSNNLILSFYIE